MTRADFPPAPQWMCDAWDEFRAAMAAPEWRDVPPPPLSLLLPVSQRRETPRPQRKPSLASVADQASKAGIEVARYEVRPDGTVVVVTGKSEPTEPNPWLADINKVTKQ
jgi:hypothetical protein